MSMKTIDRLKLINCINSDFIEFIRELRRDQDGVLIVKTGVQHQETGVIRPVVVEVSQYGGISIQSDSSATTYGLD